MRYLTAIEAAKRIGVAEKTVRLWVKEGKLEAHHPAKNRLAIAESDVERLAQERRLYYHSQPDMPSSGITQPDMSALEARVRELEQKVISLEQIVHTLTHPVTSSQAPEKAEKLYKFAVDKTDVQPQQDTQKRATIASSTIPADLPDGTLTSTEFRKQLGIEKHEMDTYIQRGVFGEPFPMTRIPHPTREGYTLTYFTPDEQARAIALLKRHGKIK